MMQIEIKIIEGPYCGKRFVFDEPDCFLFGRTVDAKVSLPNDPYVSRQHFMLEIAPPKCKIVDLGSKNGTFVNDVRYGGRKPADATMKQAPNGEMKAYIDNGDEIIVGDTRMSVVIERDAECLDCKKIILTAERDILAFVGSTFLCEQCRNERSEQEVLTLTQMAETLSHFPMEPHNKVIHCLRCKNDVTDEAGLKGQEGKVEYVCNSCRKNKLDNPLQFLEALLSGAITKNSIVNTLNISGYKVGKELGRGGMGMVYQAQNEKTGKIVAIKTMLPQVATNKENIRVFQREVAVTKQLKHKNVVQLFDHGNAQGTFFFVLEFVDGMDLDKFIKTHQGIVSIDILAPIMLDTLDGLAHAHNAQLHMEIAGGTNKKFKGVVHRDLKPQNIFLAKEGNKWNPKVADFGLSKSFESAGMTDMTQAGQIAGSPIYWPREQITHYRYLNPATDVFSIAAVFYLALTGCHVRDGFKEMFSYCRTRKQSPCIADFMKVIGSNPPIPIQRRNSKIPTLVANVLDRALRETAVPQDEVKMRAILENLRYPDAGVFGSELSTVFRKTGIYT